MSLDVEKLEESSDTPRELLRDSVAFLKSTSAKKKQTFGLLTTLFLAYQSVGIIYGDIGTSPLYVYSSTFLEAPTREDLIGALSIIIYTLTSIVTLKYVVFVLSADDYGEGGTLALYSLLSRHMDIAAKDPTSVEQSELKRINTESLFVAAGSVRRVLESKGGRNFLLGVSTFGICMVIADGMLTPAQSVLGAMQGLLVPFPELPQTWIAAITAIIILCLFAIQPFGTTKIGSFFAPIVIVWMLLLLGTGVYNIVTQDSYVLSAFSPYWIYHWFSRSGTNGFVRLGGILLAFTGVEALFADLGHLSAPAVRISWVCFAYPCLMVSYIGEAAYISLNPKAASNPFFASVPPALFWPSFVIATLATIVASQAMISGVFSIVSQAMTLSTFPKMTIRHTSAKFSGQIYIPFVNWMMCIGTIAITLAFNNTTALGNAYGLCVSIVTVITTILVSIVALVVWKWNIILALLFFLVFAFIEVSYLSATLLKVPHGAWFTLLLGVVLAGIMYLWHWGKVQQWEYESQLLCPINSIVSTAEDDTQGSNSNQIPNLKLVEGQKRIGRIQGVGIFLDQSGFGAPQPFVHFVKNFQSLHEFAVFVHFKDISIPSVADEDRVAVFSTEIPNIYRVIVQRGYSETSLFNEKSQETLDQLVLDTLANTLPEKVTRKRFIDAVSIQTTYMLGKVEIIPDMSKSRFRRAMIDIFGSIRKLSTNSKAALFGIPTEKRVDIGMIYKI